MLEPYRGAVRALPELTARAVAREMGLPYYRGALYECIEAAGFWQSDLVLALLRVNTPEAIAGAERVIGKPITRVALGKRTIPVRVSMAEGIAATLNLVGYVDRRDLRRFIWVGVNTQLPTTPSWNRFRLLRLGMTVGGYIARGGWRRDVGDWEAMGKVRLSA